MVININLDELDNLLDIDSKLKRLKRADRHSIYSTCLSFMQTYQIEKVSESQSGQTIELGGSPQNQRDWPVDKSGLSMSYILEFGNFQFHPRLQNSSFKLFLSKNCKQYKPKDQSWFYIDSKSNSSDKFSYGPVDTNPLPNSVCSLNSFIDVSKLKEVFDLNDTLSEGSLKILGELSSDLIDLFTRMNEKTLPFVGSDYYSRAVEARKMAAFFANGISYSKERADDSHYNHLVTEAKRWFVLFNLRENSICEVSDNEDVLFCIRYDDFQNSLFERGRPIIL